MPTRALAKVYKNSSEPLEGRAVPGISESLDAVKAAGLDMEETALLDFIGGVVAAPKRLQVSDWVSLLAPELGPELRDALGKLKVAVADDFNPGFTSGPAPTERVDRLRQKLDELELDGFIVPRTDEFQGEFVPVRAERLKWLTGFSGSAGAAIVLKETAAIFVDGRYTLQVCDQVDTRTFNPQHITDNPPWKWVGENLCAGSRLGFDPWLLSDMVRTHYQKAVEGVGARLVPVDINPIDAIWVNQPVAPMAPVVSHDISYAGKNADEKRKDIAKALVEANEDAALITAPESVAWLLNIRGGDVPYTPLALSYAILMSFILIFINSKINQKGFITSIVIIAIFGFIIEYLGANYGILFGAYSYGENLGLKVGNVPLIMAINWILLIIITGNFSEKVFKNSLASRVIFGSLLMVILDFFIEVSAPKLDYWEFDKHPVPLSNYIWWFVFSIIFHIVYQVYVKEKEYKLSQNILVIHFLFFGLLALFL